MNRRQRRYLAKMCGAAALSTALYPTPASSADTIDHHNVAGAHAPYYGHVDRTYPLLRRGEIAGYPNIVSMNESCGIMWSQMWTELQNRTCRSYMGAVHAAWPSNAPACLYGTDRSYGNMILSTFSGYSPASYTGTYGVFAPGNPNENKGWVCVQGGIQRPKYYACSTHLWSEDFVGDPNEAYQWRRWVDVMTWFEASSQDKKVYGAGDLYVNYSEMSARTPDFFSRYWESARCSGSAEPKTIYPFNTRVDHMFYSKKIACGSNGGVWELDGSSGCMSSLAAYESWGCNRSDHRVLAGWPAIG